MAFRLRQLRKLPFEHRFRKLRSRGLRQLLGHRLIELTLKYFFAWPP